MLYIITYTSYGIKYFSKLKKSYPNITVLGYGNNEDIINNKILEIVKFCNKHNPDDIILYVPPFQSIVININDIIAKYLSYNKPLVFSNDSKGLGYIGKCSAIIEFWKDIKLEDTDESYASKKCNDINILSNLIAIDTNSKIFYIFNKIDTIDIVDYEIKVNNESPNILISSVYGDIDNTIISLRKFGISKTINYMKTIKFEIVYLIIAIILLFLQLKLKFSVIPMCILLIFNFIDYLMYIKTSSISDTKKVIYIIISILNEIIKLIMGNIILKHIPQFISKLPKFEYTAKIFRKILCNICITEALWMIILQLLINTIYLIIKFTLLGSSISIFNFNNLLVLLLNIFS